MSKVCEIFQYINKIAPFETAMDFDNVGLLVGDSNENVKKCLVALDITNNVIKEAKKLQANLIISHHPVIFNPIKTLDVNTVPYNLVKEGISAICAHTNLDMAIFGVNSCLADALNIKNVKALSIYKVLGNELPMGLVGELDEYYNCEEFAKLVKDKLNCNGVRYTNIQKRIKKVALCSGAGGNLISEAKKSNADAFITGEIKHHEILYAVENDICVVDAGHFKTEDIVILPLISKLKSEFKSIEFIKSSACTDKIDYMV